MLRRTEAVILKTDPYSEADLIVTAFTYDFGLMKVFAKSPRKTKSRFGSSLEPLTHSRVSFWGKEDANLPRLTQSDIIRPFQTIRERVGPFLRAMEMAELTINLLPEREEHKDIFNLLLHVLDRIEQECSDSGNGMLNYIFYKTRALDMAGFGPGLDGCCRCKNTGYDFYISHGSIICEDCAKDTDRSIRLSPGVIRLYETLRRWDPAKIGRVKPSEALLLEIDRMLDNHIQYTTSKPMRTRAFRYLRQAD